MKNLFSLQILIIIGLAQCRSPQMRTEGTTDTTLTMNSTTEPTTVIADNGETATAYSTSPIYSTGNYNYTTIFEPGLSISVKQQDPPSKW